AFARPNRQLHSVLQVKESHRPIVELFADNAFGHKAQPIAIEPKRPLQVIDNDRDNGDPRFHATPLLEAERPSSPAGAASETLKHEKPTCGPGQVQRLVRRRTLQTAIGASTPWHLSCWLLPTRGFL